MNIIRLFTIVAISVRFGLDEILVRSFAPDWLRRSWLTLMFWRPIGKGRGLRLRRALEKLGPLFVKFGQVLSTRQDILPADIASALADLQDKVPAQPFAKIEATINASLGQPWQQVFESIDPQPIGSASVAQVHRGKLISGPQVAIKVLRPDLQRKIGRDISLMRTAAAIVERFASDSRRLRLGEIIDEFDRSLHEEIDLLHEAANCTQMRRNFANFPMLRIPKVHWPLCTSEVMVMEELIGTPVDQIEDLIAAGVDLSRLAKAGVEIFFTQVFRDSFFHADMHPGNLHVDDQGRFIALDYGITGTLSEFDKEYIGSNFLAFLNRDYRKVALMHVEAGWTPADTNIPQFEAAIRAVCEPIFALPLKEISFGRLLLQLFQVARRFNLIVQPQLILLQKTLLNIEGIGRRLAPELNLWETARPFLEEWVKKHRDPRKFASALIEGAPALMAVLPEVPQAVRRAVHQFNTAADDRATRERQLERRLRRSYLIIGALIGFIAAATFLA